MRRFFARFSIGGRDSPEDTPRSQFQSPKDGDSSPTTSEIDDFFFPHTVSSATESWTPEYASDPTVWEQQFSKHWNVLEDLLSVEHCDKRSLSLVQEHLSAICSLLVTEVNSQPEPSIGPILDYLFNCDILRLVHEWALRMPMHLQAYTQVMLIRTYEVLVNKIHSQNHCLLVHKPILVPLSLLLEWCSNSIRERKSQSSYVDKCFVQLLNQICRRIANDSTLLHFFFASGSKSDYSDPVILNNNNDDNSIQDEESRHENRPFLIFDLLVPYLYSYGDVGQLARDALLLIMSVSKDDDFIAHYIAYESNFCPVLATGLSGCYSELPHSIHAALSGIDTDDFCRLIALDIDALPELCAFHCALLFCNAIVQVVHDDIVRNLLVYFYGGFLNVFKSSFLEYEDDDLISDIMYFHMCLETVTEPALIQAFVKVLIVNDSKTRELNLLEVILSKMNSSERLCRVVLSLLQTLIDLRCEDLMWNSILRFILPFIPLKPNVRRFDANVSLNAAFFFLRCIPDCVRSIKELNSPDTFQTFFTKTAKSIRETSRCCQKWAFKYDGSTPNSILNIIAPDELLSVRQPFVRLSSARSSCASTGWNRYFQNRSSHGTFDGDLASFSSGGTALNVLGEEESLDSNNPLNTSGEELNEMNFNEIMTESSFDYFHFTYEGISESDESESRRGSCRDEEEERENCAVNGYSLGANQRISPGSAASEFVKAVIKMNWVVAKSRDDFIHMLNELPVPEKPFDRPSTVEENLALVDSRYQYLEELKREKLKAEENNTRAHINPFRLDLSLNGGFGGHLANGLLLTCTDEKGSGILLESLMELLTKMTEHNFSTNLKVLDVVNSLCSFGQPVLTSYLLYVDAIRTNALLRITNVINDLKVRIDAYAQGIPDFAELVRRGLKHQAMRNAELDSDRRTSARSARFAPKHYRLAFDQAEDRELSTSKNFAYAAIVLAQLCQLLSAYALQHCAGIEYPRGSRSSHSSRQ